MNNPQTAPQSPMNLSDIKAKIAYDLWAKFTVPMKSTSGLDNSLVAPSEYLTINERGINPNAQVVLNFSSSLMNFIIVFVIFGFL